MGKIVPKLNLNRTPQQAENNSLIYAKNIRIGKDGNIYGDYPFDDIQRELVSAVKSLSRIKSYLDYNWEIYFIKHLGHIVGLDDTIYLFLEVNMMVDNFEDSDYVDCILQYNETSKTFTEIQCAWYWEEGEIDGCVTTNHTGEIILTVCEKSNEFKVPIKHINLSKCSFNDDPTIYTQAPNVPITNLFLVDTYPKVIPNGVYQFFIRYEIRKNFYTNWFACSKECFAGNSTKQDTIQGSVKYVDIRRDSDTSFVFNIEHINDKALSNYKRFQLGFILSHDDEIVARTWKHFDLNATTTIYFDYDKAAIEEIDISELLKDTYELYNVGNIDYFKNKLYISNYEESDKNPISDIYINNITLPELAKNIKVDIIQRPIDDGDDSIYIDGKKLTGKVGDVYTSWGASTISYLLLLNKYNYVSSIDDSFVTLNKTLVYQLESDLNTNVDPDLWWINKAITIKDSNTKTNNTALSLINFSYDDNWVSSGLFNIEYGYPYYVSSNGRHPFNNISIFTELFYAVSTKDNKLQFGAGVCYNRGGQDHIDNDISPTIKNKLENYLNTYAPKYQVKKITCKIDNSRKIVVYDCNEENDYYTYKGQTFSKEEDIYSWVINEIFYSRNIELALEYDNASNKIYYKIKYEDTYQTLNEIEVSIASYTYSVEVEDTTDAGDGNYKTKFYANSVKKLFNRNYNISIDSSYVSGTSQKDVQYNTLMPFSNYTFYIHYISEKGIITNGYKIGTYSLNHFDYTINKSLIYPRFEDISIPHDYIGCFISISKPTDSVCEGFGAIFEKTSSTKGNLKFNCLEADALIYPLSNNIKIITASGIDITENRLGTYYPSGIIGNNTFNSFGNGGYIGIENLDSSSYEIEIYKSATIKGYFWYIFGTSYNSYYKISLVVTGLDGTTKTINCTENSNEFDNYKLKGIDFSLRFPEIYDPSSTLGSCSVYFDIIIKETAYIGDDPNNYITNFYFNVISKGENTSTPYRVYVNSIRPTAENIFSVSKYTSCSSLSEAEYWVNYTKSHSTVTRTKVPFVPDADIPHLFWVKVSSNESIDNNLLIKLTPYLSKKLLQKNSDNSYKYDNYETLNSPGYLCVVYKPNIEQGYYVSGNDIYNKSFGGGQLKLEDNSDYISMTNSTKRYIYSTCNLNYLSMSEDFVPSIRRYTSDSGSGSSSQKQIISALNSLTLSDCYKLESMYKDYTRKYFYPLDTNTITKFDNTIRSSKVIADEVFNNIYEFLPEDYYNVPANRGIITNLVAIANNIYIHTKHALYKFTGKNSLVGNEADIVTKETDVFDSGISEVFDSEIGYAGLDNKKESIVTFNAYIFYDKTANAIYAYEGQSGLTVISDPIKKLLDAVIGYNFAGKCNIVFGSDYKSDRIFINFYIKEQSYEKGAVPETTYTMIYNVCLSYNLVTKSFVSIHDFNFEYCIATRSNTYFIGNYYLGDGDPEPSYYICRINHFSFINHNNDYALDYQRLRESSIITFDGEGRNYDSVVEIICNINYETIKVLNYINWICSAVKIDSTNDLAINLGYNVPVYNYRGPNIYNNAEEPTNKYPGNTILVYTDQTKSKIVDLVRYENGKYVPNIQNDESLFTDDNKVNKKAYEYPRYNKGYWALNLFRDTVNNDKKYDSDNKSLIYGKYFVIRFTFYNTYFKLENVKLNMSNYE